MQNKGYGTYMIIGLSFFYPYYLQLECYVLIKVSNSHFVAIYPTIILFLSSKTKLSQKVYICKNFSYYNYHYNYFSS